MTTLVLGLRMGLWLASKATSGFQSILAGDDNDFILADDGSFLETY